MSDILIIIIGGFIGGCIGSAIIIFLRAIISMLLKNA